MLLACYPVNLCQLPPVTTRVLTAPIELLPQQDTSMKIDREERAFCLQTRHDFCLTLDSKLRTEQMNHAKCIFPIILVSSPALWCEVMVTRWILLRSQPLRSTSRSVMRRAFFQELNTRPTSEQTICVGTNGKCLIDTTHGPTPYSLSYSVIP